MSNKEKHWQKTKTSYVYNIGFVGFLFNGCFPFWLRTQLTSFLGYPLAYYMTAQGSLLAFVLIIFWFANKQEKIDEEFGFGEKEDD